MALVVHDWKAVPLDELSGLTGRAPEALEAERSQDPPGVRRLAWKDEELELWVGSAVLARFPREDALLLTRLVHSLGCREEVLDAGVGAATEEAEKYAVKSVRVLIPTGQDSVWRGLERRGFTVAGRWEIWSAGPGNPAPAVPPDLELSTLDDLGDHDYLALANSCFAGARGAVDVSANDWRIFREATGLDPSLVCILSDGSGPCAYIRGALRGEEGEVAAVGVLPRARRRGLGRWLLQHGGAALRAAGASSLFLRVWSGNEPARCLYREEGWVLSGAEQVELERARTEG